MRNLIFETLTLAAIAAGLPESVNGKETVYEAPVAISNQLLPKPRLEILLTKALVKSLNQKLAKFPSPQNEESSRTVRTALDRVIQPVRLTAISDDENWLEDFAHSLHRDLPRVLADEHNNSIKVSIDAVESTGRSSKLVDVAVKKKLTKVFHLKFTGVVANDHETPWIKDAQINTDYTQGGQ